MVMSRDEDSAEFISDAIKGDLEHTRLCTIVLALIMLIKLEGHRSSAFILGVLLH